MARQQGKTEFLNPFMLKSKIRALCAKSVPNTHAGERYPVREPMAGSILCLCCSLVANTDDENYILG